MTEKRVCSSCLYYGEPCESDTCRSCWGTSDHPNWVSRQAEVEDILPCVAQELADGPIFDAIHHGQQKVEAGWKQDGGKARMDLIAPEMLVGTANVLAFGAAKYAERNWEKGMSWGRCFGALMRHMWAWWAGEKADPETGYSHLHHATCCLMFLIAYEERKIGTDDRKLPVDNA